MDNQEYRDNRDQSLTHLLLKSGRLVKEVSAREISKKMNADNFKPSHLSLLAFVDFEGKSIVQIAADAEISKQAVSLLVQDLLQMEVLLKKPHPTDKRSTLVYLNKKKSGAFMKGLTALERLDELMTEDTSSEELRVVKRALGSIIEYLEVKVSDHSNG